MKKIPLLIVLISFVFFANAEINKQEIENQNKHLEQIDESKNKTDSIVRNELLDDENKSGCKKVNECSNENKDSIAMKVIPLYVVDGEMIDSTINLNANKIKTIRVLKGKQAIEKYGNLGKDGVIVITTKNKRVKP